MPTLTELGWDARWAECFAQRAPEGCVPARVAIEFNHIYRVLTGERELQAELAGRLRHRATGRPELAAVGDWVAVRELPGERRAVIEAVLPRRTRFSRRAAGQAALEQVVAANVDTVFLVMGLDGDFNLRRLERYLITAHESGARPVVVLNKADLVPDPEARVREIETVAPGVPVHTTVAVPRRSPGGTVARPDVEVLAAYLGVGRTGALLGSSGAGKSSIINALAGEPLVATRSVRAHDSRGRHTTRHRQLIVLPGRGLLIDTPGMRELQPWWDAADAARDVFEDIEALAAGCRFSDCRHRDEPQCAVKAAVERGQLADSRLASYHKLQDELRALEAARHERARLAARRARRVPGAPRKKPGSGRR